MNGGQDLGGTHGHGPVKPEPNEPVFHAEWEKRAFALTLAMGMPGGWNIDMSRFARENRPPGEYLSMSYYQIWFAGLETMLKRARPGGARTRSPPVMRCIRRSRSSARCRRATSPRCCIAAARPSARPTRRARIQAGRQSAREEHQSADAHAPAALCARPCRRDRARARLPRVSRTAMRSGAGENPQWLYTVRFDGRELWGPDGDPTVKVSVDAWEPYLEPA